MSTLYKSRPARINGEIIGALGAFIAIGVLLGKYPTASLVFVGALTGLAILVFLVRQLAQFELWQVFVLLALTGFIILTYGFANLAFHVGGVPIIIGHGLMFAALGLVAFRHRPRFVKALRDPAMRCVLGLIALTLFRLLFDIPRFGWYAVRDASMFTEGIFLLLGLVWSMERRNTTVLMKWLMILFVLNVMYVCTFPLAEQLKAWSPKSGIFLEVPLLGTYGGNDSYLLAGSLFCILVGTYVVRWPRWILVLFALVQLLGLAVLQARADYLGLLVCLFVLAMLGQVRKSAELLISSSLALVALLLLTSVLGIELSGRVGPVNVAFLREHAGSLLGERDAPAAGSIDTRMMWYSEVWDRLRSNPTSLLAGEGFGKPLIDFSDSGVATRQPHNSHLSVLARMGALGLAMWLAFHFTILKRFVLAWRARAYFDSKLFALVMWLFLLYIILMIDMSVQPGLEFSYGAIPFYFLIGFALGVIRFELEGAPSKTTSWQAAKKLPLFSSPVS